MVRIAVRASVCTDRPDCSWKLLFRVARSGSVAVKLRKSCVPTNICAALLENRHINSPGVGINIAGQKRRADLRISRLCEQHAILVGLCPGGVSSVESVGHDLRIQNSNLGWERPVQCAVQIAGRNACLQAQSLLPVPGHEPRHRFGLIPEAKAPRR